MNPKITIGKKRLDSLKRMPIIETKVRKSKDGNFIVNKTTITSIKPIEYFMSILENDSFDNAEGEEQEVIVEEEKMEI